MVSLPAFEILSFDAIPGWRDDPKAEAFAAFRRSAFRIHVKQYRTGSLGVAAASFAAAFSEARNFVALDDRAAAGFFERHFVPARVKPERDTGFVTGYYEPELEASPVRTPRFTVPLLARPPDLVDLEDHNRPAGMDAGFAFGRATRDGIVAYHDRGAIERGALDGQGLDLAWVADKVDAFFVHVQGAARLLMTDGRQVRITYAAKTGHPFTGAGTSLVALGEMPIETVTMQSIRAWFRAHPGRVDEILWRNRSYIFFREAPVDDPALGPIAAAKVPLTPGRSIAVDRLLHTFGTAFHVNAPTLTVFDGRPLSRLMIAQDTGSAITGPARGDLFAGSGASAGEIAGVVRHAADFYALLPRPLLEGAA